MIDDERLDELLLAWEERYEYGVDLPSEELCRHSSELVTHLDERIAVLKKLEWLGSGNTD
jgi:hypothetical protein